MRTKPEKRKFYHDIAGTASLEQILRTMPRDELEMNANRGGKAAIKELERRRRTEENLKHIIVTPDLDIGV